MIQVLACTAVALLLPTHNQLSVATTHLQCVKEHQHMEVAVAACAQSQVAMLVYDVDSDQQPFNYTPTLDRPKSVFLSKPQTQV